MLLSMALLVFGRLASPGLLRSTAKSTSTVRLNAEQAFMTSSAGSDVWSSPDGGSPWTQQLLHASLCYVSATWSKISSTGGAGYYVRIFPEVLTTFDNKAGLAAYNSELAFVVR